MSQGQPRQPPPKASAGNSEHRRRQNAVAQRNYRARQRERVQRLERLVAAALVQSDEPQVPIGLAQWEPLPGVSAVPPEHPAARRKSAVDASQGDLDASSSSTPAGQLAPVSYDAANTQASPSAMDFLAFLSLCTPREAETCAAILEREKFGFRDVVKYGLIHMGFSMEPSLFERARKLPSRRWLELVQMAVGRDVDLKLAFWSGLKLLSTFSVPHPPSPPQTAQALLAALLSPPEPQIPCPALAPRGNITMVRITVAAAMRSNAEQLGIGLERLAQEDGVSPIYGNNTAQIAAHVTPDLLPTPAQLSTPHHPSFDLVPWPEFRENALRAISADPPTVDEEDLCLDVLNDGLLCWGGGGGAPSLHGRGQGAPWDGRSWEAAPWFLEKYADLTGGPRGEMARNSAWWRTVRGEDLS